MERNIDKILQDKILAEERKPLPWRKEATWERIHAKSSPKRTFIPYFYAAACAGIAIIFAYTFWEQPKIGDAIHPTFSGVIEIEIPAESQHTTTQSTEKVPSFKNEHRVIIVAEKKTDILSTVENQIEDSVNLEIEPPVAVTVVDESIIATVEENSRQKVRPVIGVVINQSSDPMMVAKKKNKLKFLPHQKDAPKLSVPEPKTLTARIN